MNQEQKIDQILSHVETMQGDITSMQEDVSSIKRAVYGDARNKVLGLIDRQDQDEQDIHKLKEGRKKLGWLLAGFIAALQAVWFFIKEVMS